MKTYFESSSADVKISRELSDLKFGDVLKLIIRGPEDAEKALAAARSGAEKIIVKADDWKVISLENLIADLKPIGARIIAEASDPSEVETLLGALEHGADGVLVEVGNAEEIDLIIDLVNAPRRIDFSEAEVLEVKEVGLGERACVDTVSILELGEGMLVGNTSKVLLLVHNESMGSAFTAPRPFRVNAGAIHAYTLAPDGSTRYLSELESGKRVLIASKRKARVTAIGRVKIERRPLKLVKVAVNGIVGSITLQDAETVALLSPDEKPIPVTSIKPGDKVLAHVSSADARHFGRAVDEFIIER